MLYVNYISLFKGDITRNIRKYLETNENTTLQKLWNAVKIVLRGKFTAANSYVEEDYKINNLTLYIKKLVKEEQINPKLAEGKK